MTFSIRAGATRIMRLAAVAGTVALTTSSALWAQNTPAISIDPNVFNMYLESRIQKPADQATEQEAALVREELTDIYLLSDNPRAKVLKESPRMKAQLELQTRAILAQAVATDFVTKNPATDEEMQAVYAEQIELAPPWNSRPVIFSSKLRARLSPLITELEGGADFAELAKENSTGPSGPSGGDLGWFTARTMVELFVGCRCPG